ncbi:MAG TPA: M48 family metallopeptidase [Rhodanobacteraceae bacterium]|nr:M48 family metallopeptidase [Rhodanobacteraceae bacterium]
MKIRILVLCALMSLLGACATSPTGRSQLMLVSPAQVRQMGIASFNDMRKAGKFANAPRERAYATCVADALINVLPPPWNTMKWEVQIIKDDSANAFALPGGRIGVNQGMFKVATNQNQLAVVLGHELSHVVAHHGAERVSDNMATQLGVAAASAYGASQGMNPNTLQALLGVGSQVGILLPFSRAQESEADTLGQRFMAEAGFNPEAAVTLWQKMQKQSGSRSSFLSTHPSPGQRISSMQRGAQMLMPVYQRARASGHTPDCHL